MRLPFCANCDTVAVVLVGIRKNMGTHGCTLWTKRNASNVQAGGTLFLRD
jgi:hypothetical protein